MFPDFQVIDDWSGHADDASRPARLITAGAAQDAVRVNTRRAAVLIDRGRVVYAGPAAGAPACGEDVKRLDLGADALILPSMVNAHAHLELTAIGPVPYDGDFLDWVRMVIDRRPKTAEEQAAAVAEGIRRSVAGGVIAVGDIGAYSNGGPIDGVLANAPLVGVAFDEVLGLARDRWQPALDRARDWVSSADGGQGGQWRRAIEAHAPYTTAKPAMLAAAEACAAAGQPLAIHAAELLEEDALVREAAGPFRDRFEGMGFWCPDAAKDYGHGQSPIAWLRPVLEKASCLLAHGNYLSDEDVQTLADTASRLAYCPLASEYFRHPQPGHPSHRYREVLRAGVNVCLGTDSILCQPFSERVDQAEPFENAGLSTPASQIEHVLSQGDRALSLVPALRRLYQRDCVDPDQLLAMATVNGRDALGIAEHEPELATLQPGAPARFVVLCFDPTQTTNALAQAMG